MLVITIQQRLNEAQFSYGWKQCSSCLKGASGSRYRGSINIYNSCSLHTDVVSRLRDMLHYCAEDSVFAAVIKVLIEAFHNETIWIKCRIFSGSDCDVLLTLSPDWLHRLLLDTVKVCRDQGKDWGCWLTVSLNHCPRLHFRNICLFSC